MEKELIRLLKKKGPLTGQEIWKSVGGQDLLLWRTCKLSKHLVIRTIGTRYLRLDRQVEGFARLSPSIWREFLTYSVVGISGDPDPLEQKARSVISHIEDVSKTKLELAWQIVSSLSSRLESEWALDRQICIIIAGDIVYNMAHDVPRPEKSTGKTVKGSDMDLVVIADDTVSEDFIKRLDDAIFQEKYRLLITPHLKEEIDYVVKKIERVRSQIRFDTFKNMVACKILNEGTFLYGREDLFSTVKTMLRDHGVMKKLKDLEDGARLMRNDVEEYLLFEDPEQIRKESFNLFYPTEESDEFE
jgi:hypothetical protein